jgi:hypothetical protein
MVEGEDIETRISKLKPQLQPTHSKWERDRFIDPTKRYFAQAV